jgi:glycosyltransferase involved in cell wall biosynthesis
MAEPPLSVLMTTDAVGGVWRYSIDLCRELARLGTRIVLVCLGPAPTAAQRNEADGISPLTLLECGEALEWMPEPWEGVDRAGHLLLALERTLQPDVVHLNGFCHATLQFRAPKLVVGHSCVLSWWEAVERRPVPAEYQQYRLRVGRGLAAADAVAAPSGAMLDCLRRLYGLAHGHVIYNGSRQPSPPAGAPLAKEPIVLCVGRLWDRAKNIELLADAARDIRWPVFVAGAGEAPQPLQPLGVLSADETTAWMERASIYALPARYEPFGLSILEAAVRGAALVLGDVPSLREVWGDAALYVSPDDPRALSSAVERLTWDDALRASMARRAVERGSRFTLARQTRRYRAAYRHLVAGPRAQAGFFSVQRSA